ncbi:MAG: hypothetical protein C4291_02960 [Candidatus Dadabacteria bacterium]
MSVAGIRTEALSLKQSESRVITFICGSNRVLVRSRNHTEEKWNKNLDTVFRLSKKYKYES